VGGTALRTCSPAPRLKRPRRAGPLLRGLGLAGFVLFGAAWAAAADEADWVRITTRDGQEISLADFGFYRGVNWESLSEYRVDRTRLDVWYGGVRTSIPFDEIRTITQDPPVFVEEFGAVVIERVDGVRFRCELPPETSGVIGEDQVGDVRIPGRRIRSIEFVRPAANG